MTPPKDQAPGLVARIKDEVMTMTDADGFTWVGIEDYADRIEQLEAENAELRGKVEKAEAVLTEIADTEPPSEWHPQFALHALRNRARYALTEQANIRSPVQSEIKERFDPR